MNVHRRSPRGQGNRARRVPPLSEAYPEGEPPVAVCARRTIEDAMMQVYRAIDIAHR
jgi:hypothetical protein